MTDAFRIEQRRGMIIATLLPFCDKGIRMVNLAEFSVFPRASIWVLRVLILEHA